MKGAKVINGSTVLTNQWKGGKEEKWKGEAEAKAEAKGVIGNL